MTGFMASERKVVRQGQTYTVLDEYPFPEQRIDDWDFWSAFESGWEPELDDILADHARSAFPPDSAFIDVGAWIGPVSLIASRHFAAVHAIEPDPAAYKRLVANTGAQTHGSIATYSYALTSHSAQVKLGCRADRVLGDSMTSMIFSNRQITATGITFSEFVDQHVTSAVGLAKMDIEGGEFYVLPYMAPYLRTMGIPLLLSTHAALFSDPDTYRRTLDVALDGFDVTLVSGNPAGLATHLAVPQ